MSSASNTLPHVKQCQNLDSLLGLLQRKRKILAAGGLIEPLEARIVPAVNLVSGTIADGSVWAAGDIQRITSDATLPFGSTLTIQPGAIIQFNQFAGMDLIIQGALNAVGTAGNHILFTSTRDDTGFDGLAGTGDDIDTEANGATTGVAGDWNTITFAAGSSGSLQYADVRNGGDTGFGSPATVIINSDITLANSSIKASESVGVRINASNPTLTNNSWTNNIGAAVSMDLASNPAISGVTFSNNALNGLALDAGTLNGAQVWNDPNIVYRLTGDIDVAVGATLTVGPGQIIKMGDENGLDLYISGTLLADGTPGQPIIFTSDRDDAAGGDTDNTAFPVQAGDWNSIHFTNAGTASVMDNVQVRYAGDLSFGGVFAALNVNGGGLTLSDSVITDTQAHGIRIATANPTITGTTIANTANGFGSGYAAMSMDLASNPSISGMTLTNNNFNALMVDSGTITGNQFWDDSNVVYRLANDVTVAAGATLTIGAGQVIKMGDENGFDLYVSGTLTADGTLAQPIIFTSDRDDTAGGDTDNNASAVLPAAGDWNSLHFLATSSANLLDNVELRYAGDLSFGGVFGAIYVNGGPLTMTDSVISDSQAHGIRIENADPVLTGVTVQNSGAFGNYAAMSMDLTSNPAISDVTLTNNHYNALSVDGGTLSGSRFWNDPDIVYRLTGDVVVSAGASLTLAPGQVIKMGDELGYDLFVSGTLTADGTAAQPIIFTSDRDDSAGGDTDNNASAVTPAAGDWNSIHFLTGSTVNLLDNVEVRYAGDLSYGGVFGAIYVNGGPLTMTNSAIRDSQAHGIRIENADPTLTSVTIENSANGFLSNYAAMSMNLASNPDLTGLTLTNNNLNALNVDGGTLTGSRFWDDPDVVYRLTGDVGVDPGATLTIAPGQVIKMGDELGIDLYVGGTLNADGTAAQPIIFTSDRDDAAGGDTDNNASAVTPAAGDWNSLHFLAGSTANLLDYVEVRYAGDLSYGGVFGAIYVNGGPLTLTNSSISDSQAHGIRLTGASPVISGVTIEDTAIGFGSNYAAMSMDLASSPAISNVTLTNNNYNALNVDGGTLSASTAWDDTDIVYRLTGDVTVAVGQTLTLAPGMLIKLGDEIGVDLFVSGTLNADGTDAQPIIFTSDRDDSAGGDTDNNASAITANSGDWNSIQFTNTSTGNVLDHVEVRYASDRSYGTLGAIFADGAPLTLTNSIIRQSDNHALIARNGANVTLSNNLIYSSFDTGIRAESGAQVTAINNTIDGGFRGVGADGATTVVTITNNLISNHSRSGVFVSAGATATASYNDVYNPSATSGNYEGLTSQTGLNGNLSANPNYFNRTNAQFGLRAGSPGVDSANSSVAPTTDLFGNARFDDPNVLNFGVGADPFYDMGAIERQQVSISDVDLRALTVTGPTTGLQGQSVTVDWTIDNLGPAAVTGRWFDGVYLSVDDIFTPDDLLLGEAEHIGDLAAGGSYANSKLVTLPGVLPGDYHLIVRANSRNEIFEGTALINNNTPSVLPIAMDLPVLSVGTPVNGSLPATGSALFYRINAPAGADLKVAVDGPNTGFTNELLVSFGELPSRQSFDERGNRAGQADQSISIPDTQAGQYYAMVYGANLTGAESFSITATIAGFGITSIAPARGSNTGDVTINITGSLFDGNSQPQLIDSLGGTILPTQVYFTDSGLISATFNLAGKPLGAADVQVVNTGNVTTTLPDALNIVAGTAGHLSTVITSSGRVRLGNEFVAYLEYRNTGDTDLLAPIVRVSSLGQTELSLDPTREDPTGSLELIAINPSGPAGILSPGAVGRIPIYGKAISNGNEVLTVEVANFPTTAIDYAALEASIRPPDITDPEWTPLFAQLQTQLGTSWAGYVQQLSQDSTLLPPTLGENTSLQDVFQLEVIEARAALSTSASGTLFLDDTTRPLGDATVLFHGRTTGALFVGTSLNDGSYQIPNLVADTYDITVEGFDTAASNVVVSSADVSMDLVLTPAAILSGGVLIATTGQPLPNVIVTAISDTGEVYTTQTDAKGLYHFSGLPAGTYDLVSGQGQFVEKTVQDVVLTAGLRKSNVNLAVAIAGTISGTITIPGGAPLSGATVIAYDANGLPLGDAATSNASGVYSLTGLPAGTVTLLVSTDDYALARETSVSVSAGSTASGHNFALATGGTLTGVVTDDGGTPVPNVVLIAEIGGVVIDTTEADDNGAYQFNHLTAGSYVITASLPGFITNTANTAITNGQTTPLAPIALGSAGSIGGTLFNTGGLPLPGVFVSAWLNGERIASAITDADGEYTLGNLDLGNYLIVAGADGTSGAASDTVTLTSLDPAAAVNLALPIVGTISGHLFESDGTTPAGGVAVTLSSSGSAVAGALTDPNGYYIFQVLAAGTYSVGAFTDSEEFVPQTGLVISSGINLNTVNLLVGTSTVEGTLTSGGVPVADARVFITGASINGVVELTTDAAGHYTFTGPSGAQLQIIARPGDDLAFATQNVTLGAVPVTADFALVDGTTLSGVVRDGTTGAALAGALVQIRNLAGPAEGPIAITDAQGHYTIPGAPVGSYDIAVTLRTKQTVVLTNVALSGTTNVRNFGLEAPANVVSGLVQDSGNRPLSGALVEAHDARGNLVGFAETGVDGTYTILTLPTGSLTLSARVTGATINSLAPILLTAGGNVANNDFTINPVAFAGHDPDTALVSGRGIFSNDPPTRLDEVRLDPLPSGEQCVRVVEAFREAEARIRNRNHLFDAWTEQVLSGGDIKTTASKLLALQTAVFAGNIAKIGVKLHWLQFQLTHYGTVSLTKLQVFTKAFSDGVGIADTYLIKGRDLANAISNALANKQPLGGLGDLVGQFTGILGAVRDFSERILGEASAFGKASPILDVLLDVVGAIKDSIEFGTEIGQTALDISNNKFNQNQAKDLYIKAEVAAEFAVGRYNFEKAHCEEHDPKVKSPADVPLPGFLGGPTAGGSTTSITVRSSFDPNDKHGPEGYDDPTTTGVNENFIQPGTMPYMVEFENIGEIAAQVVTVTDTLDADFDLSTFEFTGFGFNHHILTVPAGLSHYETTLDLRLDEVPTELLVPVVLDLNLATRVITVTFSTLDPLTLAAPEGFEGFLPPDNVDHDGEGYFTYNVSPLNTVATNTVITNQANIVFDSNAPILTPTTTHTFDIDAPASAVNALAASSVGTSFQVSWQGTDAGSGIATYSVFVSDNGGAYAALLENTPDTSVIFTGEHEHTYSFYTVAADHVGLSEAAPVSADTSIFIEPVVLVPITKSMNFTDTDGDIYTVSFKGPGTLNAVLNDPDLDGKGPLEQLIADSTTTKSSITVTVKKNKNGGDGIVTIGDVHVAGGLNAFTALASDLTVGGFNATGPVKSLKFRDLADPATPSLAPDLVIGGTNVDKTTITVRNLGGQFTLSTPGILTLLSAASISDGAISAAALGSLKTTVGDMSADLTVSGNAGAITIKGTANSANWSAASFGAVTAGGAMDADIDSVGAIKSVTAKAGGLSGELNAASFGAISITGGNFSGVLSSITDAVTLGKKPAITKLTVTGGNVAGTISVAGNLGPITVKESKLGVGGALAGNLSARSFGAISLTGGDFTADLASSTSALALGKTLALAKLSIVGGDLTGDIAVTGVTGAVSVKADKAATGGSITGASITAAKIAALLVGKNLSSSFVLAGASLGADRALGGTGADVDAFDGGSIGAVTISGDVVASVIAAGLSTTNATLKDNDDTILDGATSAIASIVVKGTADNASYFAAGAFTKAPSIDGTAVVPAGDARFLVS